MALDFEDFGMDPVAVHHDLLIEIGRVDMAMDEVRLRTASEATPEIEKLSQRRAKLEAVLTRLPA